MLGSPEGKMALDKIMQGQQGKSPSARSGDAMSQYGSAKDMSQSSSMGGLLNMMNSLPQQPQRQEQGADPQMQIDAYIRSLLG
tara:strand:+ start:6894 stop:7142 length:249 start_codon:yes stop_codon:yes gene_type:complete